MKYYDAKTGKYKNDKLTDDELWNAFSWLFHKPATTDTSYKFIFFSSLLDCIEYGSVKLSFDVIYERFCYYSWPLIAKYNIRQKAKTADGRRSELENILNDFLAVSLDGKYIGWNQIYEDDRKQLIQQVKKSCKRYVVGAFWGDTKELFYSFSRREEWIELNPIMVEFVKKNKKLLHDLNYNKWAKFYESKNEDVSKTEIFLKNVDKSFVRKGENVYRSILAYEFELLAQEKQNDEMTRVNTLELLFDAELNNIDDETIDSVEFEEALYMDFSHMTEYLKDPILLINHIKKEKGILV